MHIIPVRERLRQEDHKFKANLDYIVKPDSNTNKSPKDSWITISELKFLPSSYLCILLFKDDKYQKANVVLKNGKMKSMLFLKSDNSTNQRKELNGV
jgi:hypothetical protein